jgi:hypothetical protein
MELCIPGVLVGTGSRFSKRRGLHSVCRPYHFCRDSYSEALRTISRDHRRYGCSMVKPLYREYLKVENNKSRILMVRVPKWECQ